MYNISGIRWTAEQQATAIDSIMHNEQLQQATMHYLATRVPQELEIIHKIMRETTHYYKNNQINFWTRLQVATYIYQTRQHLKNMTYAIIDTQRTQRKDKRIHTQHDKIMQRMQEIDILKQQGKTWQQIRTYLKKEHKSQFRGEDLSTVAIRHAYYEFKRKVTNTSD